MKYAKFVDNTAMDKTIRFCLEYLAEKDKQTFVKKFQKKTMNDLQTAHTVRELVVGAQLCLWGFNARYAWKVDGKTPDWSIVGQQGEPIGIVEVLAHEAPDLIVKIFRKTLRLYDGLSGNYRALSESIQDKVVHYKQIVEGHKVPFVVTVYSQLPTEVQPAEFKECVLDGEAGLFKTYPRLSGVLLLANDISNFSIPGYAFCYIKNPKPLIDFNIPPNSQQPSVVTP